MQRFTSRVRVPMNIPEAPAHAAVGAEQQLEDIRSASPEVLSDENVLRICSNCGALNDVDRGEDLESLVCDECGHTIRSLRDRVQRSLPRSLFNSVTGIRKRWRRKLGFRRAISKFATTTDPNVHLEGDRLREAIEEWFQTHHSPWDRLKWRRGRLIDDISWVRISITSVAMGTLVTGILVVQHIKNKRSETLTTPPVEVDHVERWRSQIPAEFEAALPFAERFLEARSVEQLLPVVRERQRVGALLESYYDTRPVAAFDGGELSLADAANVAGRVFLRLAAQAEDGRVLGLTMEKVGDDYLVDWESFVARSEVDWVEFKEAAPSGGREVMLRARLSFSDFYPPPFDNRSEFQSLLLENNDGEFFNAYMPRLDESLIKLREKMQESGRQRYEVIVRIRYPKLNWSADEVEITEIVQTGWVVWDRLRGAG